MYVITIVRSPDIDGLIACLEEVAQQRGVDDVLGRVDSLTRRVSDLEELLEPADKEGEVKNMTTVEMAELRDKVLEAVKTALSDEDADAADIDAATGAIEEVFDNLEAEEEGEDEGDTGTDEPTTKPSE